MKIQLTAAAWCSLAAVMVSAQSTPSYSIRTVAGTSFPGDGGLAPNAVLNSLGKVAADSAGNVYFAESGANRVHRVAPNGLLTTVFGNGSSKPNYPYALAVDSVNNILYVSDLFGDCAIWQVNLQTNAAAVIAGNGSCSASPDGPALSTSLFEVTGLALDSKGGVLFSERYGGRVRRLDLTKQTVTTILGTGTLGNGADGKPAAQTAISYAEDVKVDSTGNIFVVDNGNCVIRKVDSSGTARIVAGQAGVCGYNGENLAPLSAQLSAPLGLAMDNAGDLLYLVQGTSSSQGVRVSKIDFSANKVSTFAGNGVQGDGGDGGPAAQATLGWAVGLALNQNGGLLVSEYIGFRVRLIDSSQNIQVFAGTTNRAAGDGGPAQAALISPGGAGSDGHGGFIINDSGNRRVRAVSGGIISLVAGTNYFKGSSGDGGSATNAGLFLVYGMAVDPAGPIYVCEGTGEVRVISRGQINSATTTSFNFPGALALDATRQMLYVAEYSGDRIVRLNLSTGALTTIAGIGTVGSSGTLGDDGDSLPANQSRLSNPSDLAVDAAGNVYVMDSGNSVIRRINPNNNTMITVVGNHKKGTSPDGTLATSASITIGGGLAVDSAGDIFYAEGTKVRRVDALTQILTTIAGTATAGFSGDGGPALSAQLTGASGMSIDAQGNIYFADGSRIRVLSPQASAPLISAPIVAANYGAGDTIAPGTWIEIYGQNLSPTTRQWAGGDFNGTQAPNSLDNVKVLIGTQQAYIDYISGGQVNAQVPDGIGTGNVTVQVTSPNGTSNTVVLSAAQRAPALLAPPSFTANGKFYLAAQFTDQSFVGPPGLISGASFRLAKAGDVLTIYGVGFGQGTPAVPAGVIDTQQTSLPNVTFTIGGVNAPLAYAGLSPNFVGLYQFNVTVPSGVSGDALVQMSAGGVPIPQTLFLAVQ